MRNVKESQVAVVLQFAKTKIKNYRHADENQHLSTKQSSKIPAEGSPRLLRVASGAGIPSGEKKHFVPRESLWENDVKS
jgi:hypothetical protein